MDSRQQILNLIGLATKAGKTKSGEFSVEKSVKGGRSLLVILSEEASGNTAKMFQNMCSYYHVPIVQFGTKDELGRSCGKEARVSVSIEDAGFVQGIRKKLESAGNGGTKYENN